MKQNQQKDDWYDDMSKKGAILITGGAGYIGSHIGYFLAQLGYTPIIIDNAQQRFFFSSLECLLLR